MPVLSRYCNLLEACGPLLLNKCMYSVATPTRMLDYVVYSYYVK